MTELDHQNVAPLRPWFDYTQMTSVLSFFDGCMGRGWVDDIEAPTCAQITVADLIFVAGDAESPDATAMVRDIPLASGSAFAIFIPENNAWADLISRCHPEKTKPFTRYAFHHGGSFPMAKLRQYRDSLPAGYRLARIDETLYHQCLASPLQDLCSQFADAQDYLARGLGFCAVQDGIPVGGASSYTVFDGGIEIEVDTLEAHRQKGIATACSAALILECLAQNCLPCWDAANLTSKALAEKLGYVYAFPYTALEVALAPQAEGDPLGCP